MVFVLFYSNFSDIFDIEWFIATLAPDVQILKEVPSRLRITREMLYSTRAPRRSEPEHYIRSILPLLRRKNAFVVIAVDAYETCGNPGEKLAKIIQKTINATRTGLFSHSPGYILSTALSLRETVDVLRLSEAENEFDA